MMDERIEYQARWLEEAVNRVTAEANSLAGMVDRADELLGDLLQTAATLHEQLEAVKGKLTPRAEVVEESPVAEAEEVVVEIAKPTPKRRKTKRRKDEQTK